MRKTRKTEAVGKINTPMSRDSLRWRGDAEKHVHSASTAPPPPGLNFAFHQSWLERWLEGWLEPGAAPEKTTTRGIRRTAAVRRRGKIPK